MDAVILAAGRNDRLKGRVPAYLKPLITVNGVSLIVDLVTKALAVANCVVIVVAPQNAQHIVDVVHSALGSIKNIHYVIQPSADGPVDALDIAMNLVHDDRVMVLCADNIIPLDVIVKCASDKTEAVISTSEMTHDKAQRFTYFVRNEVYEKQPVPKDAPNLVQVWVGPLVVHRGFLNAQLSQVDTLSELIGLTIERSFVLGNVSDIGVPEELP